MVKIIKTFNDFLRGFPLLCHSFCFLDQPETSTRETVTIRVGGHRLDSAESRQKIQVDVSGIWTCPAAVSFQLRAWTDRYEDWVQVRSDLSVAVDDALTRENITIA